MPTDAGNQPDDADVRRELSSLRNDLESLTRRLEVLERRVRLAALSAPPVPPPPAEKGPEPGIVLPGIPMPRRAEGDTSTMPPAATVFPAVPPPAGSFAGERAASLERRIGVSWFIIIGVASLFLAAIFFFKLAIDRGWVKPAARCVIIALGGGLLIGVGEWALRRTWRTVSAVLAAGGAALFYAAVYAAGPHYDLIGRPGAFGLMCVVTVLAVALSLRADLVSTGIVALVGAYLTPVLLRTGTNEQTVLMLYLSVVDAGFLLLATLKRWRTLVPIVWGGAAALFIAWASRFYTEAQAVATTIWLWVIWTPLVAHVLIDRGRGGVQPAYDAGLRALLIVGAAVTTAATCLIWATGDPVTAWVQVLVVAAVGLGLSWRFGWHLPRPFMWAAAAAVLAVSAWHDAGWDALVPGIWVFAALFLGDVLMRSRERGAAAYDVTLAAATIAATFRSTHLLLRPVYGEWMGAYTVFLAAGALGLMLLVRALHRPAVLEKAFLFCGYGLLLAAPPVQFDDYGMTLAWAAQALVATVIARRLRHSYTLWFALSALGLALLRFSGYDRLHETALGATWFAWVGEPVPWAVLMALGLSGAALACAAMIRWWGDRRERDVLLATIVLWHGALVFGAFTQAYLPTAPAGWAWWLLAVGVAAVMGRHGRSAGLLSAAFMLLIAAGRWFGWQTLGRRLTLGAPVPQPLVMNATFLLGLALSAALGLFAKTCRRGAAVLGVQVAVTPTLLILAAALAPVWALSFEVDRYAVLHATRFEDWILARQMAWSILWAVYAAGLIVVGFAARKIVLRYLAIAILAVTLMKVFLVDMRGVEAIYRILSFLALGAVFVVLSLLYHRHFSRLLTDREAITGRDQTKNTAHEGR